jgi:hypothetical protein
MGWRDDRRDPAGPIEIILQTMTTPLVSVVIPTARRPMYLPRAVASALECAPDGDVEVIVVPNGPDMSWRGALERFSKDPRVRCSPIDTLHACAARNHGLTIARGMYVRFLDDDDYLYPEAAAAQLALLESEQLDAMSGAVDLVDETGLVYRKLLPVSKDDWPSSMLGPRRVSIPLTHILRMDVARRVKWREDVPWFQDVDWLLSMVRSFPGLRWRAFPVSVGAWYQHSGPRTSPGATTQATQEVLAMWLADTVHSLGLHGELSEQRRTAAARGLWHCAHRAFQFNPLFWTNIVRRARALDPDVRPEIEFLGFDLGRLPFPVLMEWGAVAPRLVSHAIRRLYHRVLGPPRRRLTR